MTVRAEIWTAPDCAFCAKAKDILMRHGIEFDERVVLMPDDVADFAMYDIPHSDYPLLRVWNAAGIIVRRWGQRHVRASLTRLIEEAVRDEWKPQEDAHA